MEKNEEKAPRIHLLREAFAKLPEEYEREYELTLTKKVNMREAGEAELRDIVTAFNANRESYSGEKREREEKIAYAAIYCLSILYRHSFDCARFQEVASESGDWCRLHKTFCYLEILLKSNDPEELRGQEETYLKALHRYAEDYPDNAGYVHSLANLYAKICEDNYAKREHFRRIWHEKAEEAVNRAILLAPDYALYYCTKGRIALINGSFDEADMLFEKAMHKEDSAARDGYGIRISRYLSYKSQVQMLRTAAQAQEQIDELKAASVSNIEVLTFFSGIVAFIIGGFSLADGQTAADAAFLIVVLMGALLSAFSAFSFLLQLNIRRESKIRMANIIVGILGAMIAIGGTCFVLLH